MFAERKLLQSFLIFKNWTSDSLKLDLLLEVSSKLLGVDQSHTAFLPNKQEAPQPLTLGHLERWMTILESLLKQDLWVSTFSIADLESWWVGRSLLKKALDNFQCPDLEHLEGQLVESSIFRCSHMSQRTWLCSWQHCSESRRLQIFCHSEISYHCNDTSSTLPRWSNVAADFKRAPTVLIWYPMPRWRRGHPVEIHAQWFCSRRTQQKTPLRQRNETALVAAKWSSVVHRSVPLTVYATMMIYDSSNWD